jgi:hypothetical protein
MPDDSNLGRSWPLIAVTAAAAYSALVLYTDVRTPGAGLLLLGAIALGAVVGRWWVLALTLVPVLLALPLPQGPGDSTPWPFVAGGMVPLLFALAVGVAGRKLVESRLSRPPEDRPGAKRSLVERLLPPAPRAGESLFALHTDSRALVWFVALAAALALLARAFVAKCGLTPGVVFWVAVIAFVASFLLSPRRRHQLGLVVFSAAALVVLAVAAFFLWLLIASLGCAPDAYECPI